MTQIASVSHRDEVLLELRGAHKFIITTHENADGDALGSLSGMAQILVTLGKDVVCFLGPNELPLPAEYRFLEIPNLTTTAPDDLASRIVIFLDCGNIDRNPADALKGPDARILNIDHHHDNTHFGTVDHVVPAASCTAEIVWDLMRDLDVDPTRSIAEALYVGLVTDTGRFMYENTGTQAHRMAAELIDAGVDVQQMFFRLYEGVPEAKARLFGRGLSSLERFDNGLLSITYLLRSDFEATQADESFSEGLVDELRAIAGTAVGALVRDTLDVRPGRERKVSLRASDDRIDVSQIARGGGGGGHRRAAGFSTELEYPQIIEFLRAEIEKQL